MKKSKILSLLLAVVMILTTVPVHAANGNTTPTEEGKVYLTKEATLTDDGSYTINMEAYATGTTTTQTIEKGVPLDIVLVLDQSGSMKDKLGSGKKQEALKTAAKNFVNKVYQNGQKFNVEHRIGIATFAGGNGKEEQKQDEYKYMHTGIYDENGTFIGYEKTSTSKPTYQKFNGAMDTNGTYYVMVGSEHVKLTYNKNADQYVEATNPSKDDEKTYYDVSGNQLTWIEETTEEYIKVTSGDFNGTEYYIDTNKNPESPNWVKLTYKEAYGIGSWKSTDGKIYVKQQSKNGMYQFKHRKVYYDAYTKESKPTGRWILSADGKTEIKPVYEKTTGKGVWQYKDGKKTVNYTNEPVYIQTTASVFGPALVPVADGANGAGSKRTNFDKAINSLKEEGPTRVEKGVELGNKIFEANPIPAGSDRQRIMIVFTDGEPGWDGSYDDTEASAAVAQTKVTKDTYGATVYTIGLYSKESDDQKKFMENMSSNTTTDKKYYHKVSDAAALDGVFQSIQEDISGSTTSVDLTTESILRDIMSAEGFELTDKSVVTVSVVPGDATNAADHTQIKWGTPVQVLTLTNPTDGKAVTGTYKNMTIKASTYMTNPEAGKADLHTVDVTGFDYKEQYVAQAHKGSKLVVEITGVKALPTVTTDQNIFTNDEQSGIWAARELKAPFPKNPETYMSSKAYVVDYAKPLNLATTEFKMNTAKNIDKAGYNPFAPANTKITHKYGDVTLADGKLTYAPKTMKWDGYDTFYVFGTTTDATVKAASANSNGNLWSKVHVIPANNVYYEDSFVSNESNGTVGITYDGTWNVVTGTEPDQNGGAAEGTDDVQGWIPVLENEKGDTDGSSHTATGVDNTATATFTFTGTGADVYSRTNGQTGTISVKVKDASNKTIFRRVVDTLSASGDYYQIPTLSIHSIEIPILDKDGKVIRIDRTPLEYGTYTVELKVTNGAKDRLEYYLDGIRVYNPMQNGDTIVDEAYGADELNATFVEVRDNLLDQNSFTADKTTANAPVFIDQLTNEDGTTQESVTTTDVGTYRDFGPKNEVYLTGGQSISFKVDTTLGNNFYVGLKAPEGQEVTFTYSNGKDKKASKLSHTADMYYKVAPAENGVITIENDGTSGALLSVTKLKVTNANTAVNTATVFAAAPVSEIVAADRQFRSAAISTPDPEPTPDPDVDIENPEVPDKPVKPSIKDILDKIFGGFFGWM